jgi:DNA/RNA endonuclease YhcR with UshA esterase domain
LLVAAALCLPAFAHHGDAGRYEDNLTVLTGTVVDLQLITPHSIIVLDVTDESGKTVRWQAELGSRTNMIRDFGWTKDTLKPGDKITMTGRKVKSGAPYMNLTDRANIVMADGGKEIFRTNNYGTEERKRPAAGLTNP